jgi:hypothetical protein
MPAPQFPANTVRFDPYKNYRFRVKWDGNYVAGVNKVSMLKRSTEAVQHRMGGDPSVVRLTPGRRNSTAWATPSPFKCSNSRMKDGSATLASQSRRKLASRFRHRDATL